jgi:hypoxanthine phosphoribosyltransferase
MADKLIIDWKEYNHIVEKLALQIHSSGYKPDLLIGIARGGLPITDVLSRIFKLKCAYLAVESYSGKGIEDQQGELIFSREMSSTVQNMKGNILLCDDLSDTGVTLNKSIDWLRKYPPLKGNIKNIKTAVLWKKKDSTFEPDFCAQKLNHNPWIVQPFEKYEEIRINDLIQKHKS